MTEETQTECRSVDGVTVGIIDAIITLYRLMKCRSLESEAVQAALKDLYADPDVHHIFPSVVGVLHGTHGRRVACSSCNTHVPLARLREKKFVFPHAADCKLAAAQKR